MAGARVIVDRVSRSFETGAEPVWALREVSLGIEPGEFLAVVGRSGSGKTTLLNLIAGLDRPTSGSIRIDELDVGACTEDQLTSLRRHRIGFIFQSFGLLPLLSALENVDLALRIAGAPRGERGRRAREVLELVGLGRRLNHRPYELSGGEQQRVGIARALANRPTLILADEPTGELDSTTGLAIFSLLRDLVQREGVTLITGTHDPKVIERAGRVEELADGALRPPTRPRLPLPRTAEPRAATDWGEAAPAPPGSAEGQSMAPATAPVAAPEPADDVSRWAPPERRHG